eukprot:3921815-Pleurochrysis_carterae.AAC.4
MENLWPPRLEMYDAYLALATYSSPPLRCGNPLPPSVALRIQETSFLHLPHRANGGILLSNAPAGCTSGGLSPGTRKLIPRLLNPPSRDASPFMLHEHTTM